MSIRVTQRCGFVLRRDALRERGIPLAAVLAALEAGAPLDESEDLISFGPIFPDSLDELHGRLVDVGLVYVDDFFELIMDYPDWLAFRVEFVGNEASS